MVGACFAFIIMGSIHLPNSIMSRLIMSATKVTFALYSAPQQRGGLPMGQPLPYQTRAPDLGAQVANRPVSIHEHKGRELAFDMIREAQLATQQSSTQFRPRPRSAYSDIVLDATRNAAPSEPEMQLRNRSVTSLSPIRPSHFETASTHIDTLGTLLGHTRPDIIPAQGSTERPTTPDQLEDMLRVLERDEQDDASGYIKVVEEEEEANIAGPLGPYMKTAILETGGSVLQAIDLSPHARLHHVCPLFSHLPESTTIPHIAWPSLSLRLY